MWHEITHRERRFSHVAFTALAGGTAAADGHAWCHSEMKGRRPQPRKNDTPRFSRVKAHFGDGQSVRCSGVLIPEGEAQNCAK
jgi:hypothetical protein